MLGSVSQAQESDRTSLCGTDWLPMVPGSCSLDQDGLGTQVERYRVVGEGAQVIEQDRRRLVIRVRDGA